LEIIPKLEMNVSNKISDRLPASGLERRSVNRPIRFWEMAAVTVFLTFLTVLIFSILIVQWNQKTLYLEKIQTGKSILIHLANNAAIPLLQEDTLTLNSFVKGTNKEEFLYAVIVDSKNIIKAHTDPAKIGAAFKESATTGEVIRDGKITQAKYMLPTGTQVLNLSRPVLYMDKIIGTMQLGLSLDLINGKIKKETFSLIREIIPWGLLMLVVAAGVSIFLSIRLHRSMERWRGIETEAGRGQPLQEGSFSPKTLNGFIKAGSMEDPSQVTRNHVTVFFAGIKGFKAYANNKSVEEVLKDLNEYFTIATQCILDHGGHIDKFLGDSVVGVFGYPPLQTDPSQRAVKSAIAMLKELQIAGKNGNQLLDKVGIGISSGVVLSGHISTPPVAEYTSIGESFREAYLLNVIAGPGEIVLSKEVYQIVKSFVVGEPLPPREIMQKTEPWENFRLRYFQ
jgi:adenylate cyclase